MPYTVVIGVAMPTIIKDAPGSLDMRTDTGILMQNAKVIPWIMTGILLPRPAIFTTQTIPTNKKGRLAFPTPRKMPQITLYAIITRIPPEQIRI